MKSRKAIHRAYKARKAAEKAEEVKEAHRAHLAFRAEKAAEAKALRQRHAVEKPVEKPVEAVEPAQEPAKAVEPWRIKWLRGKAERAESRREHAQDEVEAEEERMWCYLEASKKADEAVEAIKAVEASWPSVKAAALAEGEAQANTWLADELAKAQAEAKSAKAKAYGQVSALIRQHVRALKTKAPDCAAVYERLQAAKINAARVAREADAEVERKRRDLEREANAMRTAEQDRLLKAARASIDKEIEAYKAMIADVAKVIGVRPKAAHVAEAAGRMVGAAKARLTKANERAAFWAQRAQEARDEANALEEALKAQRRVVYTTPDGVASFLFDNEEDARAKARSLSLKADARRATNRNFVANIQVKDLEGHVVVEATIGERRERADLASAIAKSFAEDRAERLMADNQIRTGAPAVAVWIVQVREDDKVISSRTFHGAEAAKARSAYDAFVAAKTERQEVDFLHYGVLEETTDARETRKSRMVKIRVFRPGLSEMEEVMPSYIAKGPMARKLMREARTNDLASCLVRVEAHISGLHSEDEAVKAEADAKAATWRRACENGFVVNGVTFAPFGHGTNAAKEGKALCCPAYLAEVMRSWLLCNPQPGWVRTDAKETAYGGLLSVWTKAWPLPFGPKDAVVAGSTVRRTITAKDVLDVQPNGDVRHLAEKAIEQPSSDGQAIISLSSKKFNEMTEGLSRAEKRRIRRDLEAMRGHSFRMGLMKGYALVMPLDGAQRFLRSRGIATFGGRPIDDVVFFADATVFKGLIGEMGSHLTWEDYLAGATEEGDKSAEDNGMLLESHGVDPEPSSLSAQFWRALQGITEEQVLALLQKELGLINSAKFADLIGGLQGKLMDACPALKRLPRMRARIRAAQERLLAEAARGELHGLVRTYPVTSDPFVSLVKWTTGEDIHLLPAGKVVLVGANTCPWFHEGMEVVVYRSPLTDAAGIRVVRLHSGYAAAGVPGGEELDASLKADGTLIWSADDIGLTAMRADVDGDHLSLIVRQDVVEMVKDHHARCGAPIIDWAPVSGGGKRTYSREGVLEHFASLVEAANVGQPDDLISKIVFSNRLGAVLNQWEEEAIAQGVYRFNNAVDAGKHGLAADPFRWSDLAVAALNERLPYGVGLNKAERWPGRDVKFKDKPCGSVLDFIRNFFEVAELEELPDFADGEPLPDVVGQLQLPDAEAAPWLYGFAARPRWHFFPTLADGTTAYAWEKIYFIDSMKEVGRKPHGVRYDAHLWCVHDPETGKGYVYDAAKNLVEGTWILDQDASGYFNALRGLLDEELAAIEAEEDKARAAIYRANLSSFARRSVAAYAACYGYGVRDAFNKVIAEMFKPEGFRLDNNAWHATGFDLTWLCQVFAPEVEEVIGLLHQANEDEAMTFVPELAV